MSSKPVVVVTGTSKGIGLAVTSLLLDRFGAIVVAISRHRSAAMQELVSKNTSTLLFIECDVTDATAFGHAISTAQKTYGHIDSLVLNAGVLEPTGKITSPDLNLEAWKAHFEVNFFSQVTAVRTVMPWLHKSELGGKIVFVSSGAATGNTHGWAPYNASKAASNSLCRTLAQEEPNVVCVAVRPGKVDTAMQALVRSLEGKMRDEDLHKFIREHKEGNLVDPEDCGHVIAALALKAPQELTGKFVSWDSEECREYWDDQ